MYASKSDAFLCRWSVKSEIAVGNRADVRGALPALIVADELDPMFVQHVGNARDERVGDRGVDDERLGGVAHARALGLGVHDDLGRFIEISLRVDVHVTVAVAVDDHGDGRVLADALDERRPAARDQAVDHAFEAHRHHRQQDQA